MKRKHLDLSWLPVVMVCCGCLLLIKPVFSHFGKQRTLNQLEARHAQSSTTLQASTPPRTLRSLSPRRAFHSRQALANERKPLSTSRRPASIALPKPSRAPASLEAPVLDEPVDISADLAGLPSEVDLAESDARDVSAAADFEAVHRHTSLFLQNLGLDQERIRSINAQREKVRSEVQAIAENPELDPRDAQRLVEFSMQEYYRLMAHQLGPEAYSSLMQGLQNSKDL